MTTADPKDITPEELVKEMDRLINQGATVFAKFTCEHCGSRQTSSTPNAIFTEGYDCEACGKIAFPEKYGMMVMMGQWEQKIQRTGMIGKALIYR